MELYFFLQHQMNSVCEPKPNTHYKIMDNILILHDKSNKCKHYITMFDYDNNGDIILRSNFIKLYDAFGTETNHTNDDLLCFEYDNYKYAIPLFKTSSYEKIQKQPRKQFRKIYELIKNNAIHISQSDNNADIVTNYNKSCTNTQQTYNKNVVDAKCLQRSFIGSIINNQNNKNNKDTENDKIKFQPGPTGCHCEGKGCPDGCTVCHINCPCCNHEGGCGCFNGGQNECATCVSRRRDRGCTGHNIGCTGHNIECNPHAKCEKDCTNSNIIYSNTNDNKDVYTKNIRQTSNIRQKREIYSSSTIIL